MCQEYAKQAGAVYMLKIICEALNNGQPYDEDGTTWCPIYWFYTKDELAEMGEAERKNRALSSSLLLVRIMRRMRVSAVRLRMIGVRIRMRIVVSPLC